MPFSRDHGIVLSGMWSRESELQYPAWKFPDCFLLNPVMVFLLPFLGIYFVTVAADWALTGKNHVDKKINPKILIGILVFLLIFGVIRNLPFYPFRLLVPGGLAEVLM